MLHTRVTAQVRTVFVLVLLVAVSGTNASAAEEAPRIVKDAAIFDTPGSNYDPSAPGSWRPGQRVMARWLGADLWFAATVVHVHKGWYHLRYDDGDQEANTANLIEPLDPSKVTKSSVGAFTSTPASQNVFGPGEPVLAKWMHGNKGEPATVMERSGIWYHVVYQDGRQEVTQGHYLERPQ
jgi:hypothetical protein